MDSWLTSGAFRVILLKKRAKVVIFMKYARKYYLDNMRWMTVILVVIYHTLMMYSGLTGIGTVVPQGTIHLRDSYSYFVYPWFMMILFIISGISARISLEHNPSGKAFLKKRTVRYLVPSTLGLFVFQWIQGYISMKLSNSFETIPETTPKFVLFFIMSLSGTGVLWYLQVLWLYSLILVIIRKFTKKQEKLYQKTENFPVWGILLTILPAVLSAQVLNTPVILTYRLGIYGFAFFAGYYIFAHEEVIHKISQYSNILLVLSVLMGIGCTVYFWGQNYADYSVVNHPISVAYGWLMCLSLSGIAKKYLDFQNSVTAWFCQKSFGLYIFHYLGMSLCAYLLNTDTALPEILRMMLTLLFSFLIGYGLYEIISRIPVLRWCVLGISRKQTERKDTHVQG